MTTMTGAVYSSEANIGAMRWLDSWKPNTPGGWFMMIIAAVFFVEFIMRGADVAWELMSFDDSAIVVVYDHEPKEIVSKQGDPIYLEYLYTKRACDATVNYSIQSRNENGVVQEQYSLGPFNASWPATEKPRWITQTMPMSFYRIEPGEYELFWKVSGLCTGENGERPSSRRLFATGPTTYLTITEK